MDKHGLVLNLTDEVHEICGVMYTEATATVTDANGCSEPDDITITVFPLPLTAAGPDVRICEGNSIKIGGTPTGPPGSQYSWSPGGSLNNSSAANPIASPTETKMYCVTVTSSQG